jgi:nodulation protein E
MPGRRVVVTGVGVISALGRNRTDFWGSLQDGRSGIGPIQAVQPSRLRYPMGAEVRGYDPKEYFVGRDSHQMDRFAQFALIAAREAIQDSRIELRTLDRTRAAVITGSCIGGQTSEDQQFQQLYGGRKERLHPLTVPWVMANAATSHITIEFGFQGPSYTLSTACSSASHAIGHAYWALRHGMADIAITGGAEAPFSFGHLKAWEALRVLSLDTCRPFSKDRRGTILGEGAAMMVIEPLDAAVARGAHIYVEIAGFGMSADAMHLTHPSSDGAALAIRNALQDGGLHPEQIAYINAHGSGTILNDPAETRCIRSVFGDHAEHILVSSTKSMHGHMLGAAGAVEAVATTLALRSGIAPPTANYTQPDPECDLDYVPNQSRPAAMECALSNSFAFGGLNAVLAFRRWKV